jgi:glycosyltransferase involved in cell wall biosynthesis
MKVLITAPNLDENTNVSGISSVVRQIIERGSYEYLHFESGRRDGEPANLVWIFKQIVSVPRFWWRLVSERVDLVHLNTNYNPLAIVRDAVYAATARMAGVPVLLHLHGGRFLAEEFKNRWLEKIAEITLRRARVAVVLSELEKEIIERRWGKLNVRVLENAVPFDEAPRQERNNPEPVLIFLGRLSESKGLHEIIEACRRLKNENFDFRFNCFGAGPLKEFFITEMSGILGDKFYFGGVIKGAEKWRRLAEADIFLLPSRHGEGLPIAMLEAMAAGCVVIASEMASIGAVVEDGANGYTIEPGNVSELVTRLKHILDNKADWKRLRDNARAIIKEKFDLDDYIKKLENIYAEIGKRDLVSRKNIPEKR